MKKAVLKLAASVSVSIGFMGGVAVAAPVVTNTGMGSYNKIKVTNKQLCELKNKNTISAKNVTTQSSSTGNAKVKNNTTGGTAVSGAAGNTNTAAAGVAVSNPTDATMCDTVLATDGSDSRVANTGAYSVNVIENKNTNKVKVVNSNNISIYNATLQGSHSGNAIVQGNTTGGSATSGSATNTSTSTFTINVTN